MCVLFGNGAMDDYYKIMKQIMYLSRFVCITHAIKSISGRNNFRRDFVMLCSIIDINPLCYPRDENNINSLGSPHDLINTRD
jgi:hypothetical protein